MKGTEILNWLETYEMEFFQPVMLLLANPLLLCIDIVG